MNYPCTKSTRWNFETSPEDSSENSTKQKETIKNNTTEQFKETETCDQITIGGDKTGERKVQTKDQSDKARLSALVQSVSDRVKSWRQKDIRNGGPEKLKVITHKSKKIKTVSIKKNYKPHSQGK